MKIYKDRHVNKKLIIGKKVLILGYGNQGRAQALALRKSGAKVEIHLRPKSHTAKQAEKDGFPLRDLKNAVPQADYVAFLTPDEWMPEVFEEVKPFLRRGQALVFAHALAIHFNLIKIPNGIDTLLAAPLGPGKKLWELFQAGKGMTAWAAARPKKALPKALAYAWGIGSTRAGVIETTFRDETLGDLFGEQAFLCGGLLAILLHSYQTMRKHGLSDASARLETLGQIDALAELLKTEGAAGFIQKISPTAAFGAGKAIERMKLLEGVFEKLFREIDSGRFVKEWMRAKRKFSKEGLIKKLGLKKLVRANP
ncbi:MAG: ketol-acid reductoisomerase [candidate division Zixibacteria bacterium]|nr:ketol-acid reductoisomerase [candidate division Zixibacteria bacterium]MCI0596181.1 ketol-acid reductoisomerase [candidate division Zixibacteria bacterium]